MSVCHVIYKIGRPPADTFITDTTLCIMQSVLPWSLSVTFLSTEPGITPPHTATFLNSNLEKFKVTPTEGDHLVIRLTPQKVIIMLCGLGPESWVWVNISYRGNRQDPDAARG